ncbi:hypothetical protein CKO28_18875 [Rhodovibrio sodomensis]|uniref:Uncharacterized protein n=1 Tax=Rhodovibrio sodomensis TaxID=1088 RepID=A0ABS1DK61_9PROT|nr:hypothetical protein [Rhodovibrio sodomensis]MBK1670103.1 hypothetical protein [Rhodovibrio sodomensis]
MTVYQDHIGPRTLAEVRAVIRSHHDWTTTRPSVLGEHAPQRQADLLRTYRNLENEHPEDVAALLEEMFLDRLSDLEEAPRATLVRDLDAAAAEAETADLAICRLRGGNERAAEAEILLRVAAEKGQKSAEGMSVCVAEEVRESGFLPTSMAYLIDEAARTVSSGRSEPARDEGRIGKARREMRESRARAVAEEVMSMPAQSPQSTPAEMWMEAAGLRRVPEMWSCDLHDDAVEDEFALGTR